MERHKRIFESEEDNFWKGIPQEYVDIIRKIPKMKNKIRTKKQLAILMTIAERLGFYKAAEILSDEIENMILMPEDR